MNQLFLMIKKSISILFLAIALSANACFAAELGFKHIAKEISFIPKGETTIVTEPFYISPEDDNRYFKVTLFHVVHHSSWSFDALFGEQDERIFFTLNKENVDPSILSLDPVLPYNLKQLVLFEEAYSPMDPQYHFSVCGQGSTTLECVYKKEGTCMTVQIPVIVQALDPSLQPTGWSKPADQ
jgi:hypothetical protein